MTILLIRLEQDTDLDILGVINYKFPRLSSFRLSIQLLIVNLILTKRYVLSFGKYRRKIVTNPA